MFLVDDITLFPVKSILTLFREIYKAAAQEMAEEAESLRNELGQLYQMLETGVIGEDDFDTREQQILDRLDAIEARNAGDEDDDEIDDEEEDDDEIDDEEEDDEDIDDEVDDDDEDDDDPS